MYGNGVGIPVMRIGIIRTSIAITVEVALPNITLALAKLMVGTVTIPTGKLLVIIPATGTSTMASALSALQASKYELWLCSTSVAQAVSHSGTGT